MGASLAPSLPFLIFSEQGKKRKRAVMSSRKTIKTGWKNHVTPLNTSLVGERSPTSWYVSQDTASCSDVLLFLLAGTRSEPENKILSRYELYQILYTEDVTYLVNQQLTPNKHYTTVQSVHVHDTLSDMYCTKYIIYTNSSCRMNVHIYCIACKISIKDCTFLYNKRSRPRLALKDNISYFSVRETDINEEVVVIHKL